MTEKSWLQQDFILVGFTRLGFILLLMFVLMYSLLWYGIGLGVAEHWFKKIYWRYFWWIEYWR